MNYENAEIRSDLRRFLEMLASDTEGVPQDAGMQRMEWNESRFFSRALELTRKGYISSRFERRAEHPKIGTMYYYITEDGLKYLNAPAHPNVKLRIGRYLGGVPSVHRLDVALYAENGTLQPECVKWHNRANENPLNADGSPRFEFTNREITCRLCKAAP
ncbi:hypothetical protein [Amycolatopsis sp. CA-230715]|uniref:hypothetical protein n=1 Tax=Amycolatopsis sp. CA-230715 TaxID=2745196 RepID=UPI001C030709|nr:hypothetical protein [Amycolatopsis sp. CA-230715]QWF85913.1 hypothetical protein HUW46_09393 [Amycolatopsis sp. CA-230715]